MNSRRGNGRLTPEFPRAPVAKAKFPENGHHLKVSMSIDRKGSRRILVDSTAYRWTVRSRPTYIQTLAQGNLRFAVELEDLGRTVLIVTVDAARPDNWMMAEASIISPSIVERAIRLALDQGWCPGATGSAFALSLPE